MRCAIWYHGGVLILVKLQALAWNFTKINIPPWVFFTFLKLYKWYRIAQRTTYNDRVIQKRTRFRSCRDKVIIGYLQIRYTAEDG